MSEPLKMIAIAAALLLCAIATAGATIDVRNGGFSNVRGVPMTDGSYQTMLENGVQGPPREQWADWWSHHGKGGVFAFPRTGGENNDAYARITGKNALLVGYSGTPLTGDFIFVFWAKGRGKLNVGAFSYVMVNGTIRGAPPGVGLPAVTIDVNSDEWVCYRIYVRKHVELHDIHPMFQAVQGMIDIDTVSLEYVTPALGMVVQAEMELRRDGKLVTDRRKVAADEVYWARANVFRTAVQQFEEKAGDVKNKALVSAFNAFLEPRKAHLLTEGIQAVESAVSTKCSRSSRH